MEILSASSQIQKMLAAYIEEQNMEKILSFVTPDICWKENEEVHLHGWQELEEFLKTVLVSPKSNILSILEIIEGEKIEEKQTVYGTFVLMKQCVSQSCFCFWMTFEAQCRWNGSYCLVSSIHFSDLLENSKTETGLPPGILSRVPHKLEQDMMETFAQSIPSGVLLRYPYGDFPLYSISNRLLEYLGYSYEEYFSITKGDPSLCIHPEDRAKVFEKMRDSLSRHQEYQIRYRVYRKNNTYSWVLERGKWLQVSDKCTWVLSLLFSIDDSMQLQNQLLQGQKSLDLFYSIMGSGIAKIAADDRYTLLFATDRFYTLLGYTQKEMEREFQNQMARVICPEDLPYVTHKEQLFRKDLQQRMTLTFRFVKKSGDFQWVRLDAAKTDETYHGHSVYYCFYTDIHQEMQRINQRYLEDLSSYNGLMEVVLIVSSDSDRRFLYAGKSLSMFLGYTDDKQFLEDTRQGLSFFLCPEDRQHAEQNMKKQLQHSSHYEVEYRIRKQDGSYFWVMERGNRIEEFPGQSVLVCILVNDLQRRTIDSTLLMENEYAQDVSQLGKSLLWSYDFSKKTHPYIPLAQIHSQDKENVEKFFELCRKGKEPPSLEFRGKEKDISPLHWYRIFGVILKDECGIPTQAVGHIEDIQLEKEQSARLELATHCDSMTGLYHMTYMHQELDRFLQQFGEEVNGAFFIMDIDDFSRINQSLGHIFGDAVLGDIAKVLQRLLPEDSLISRISGDNFAFFLRIADQKEQEQAALKIQKEIAEVYTGDLQENGLTCSMGVACYPSCGNSFLSLFQAADAALYRAKQQGKNRIVWCKTSFKQEKSRLLPFYLGSEEANQMVRLADNRYSQFLNWAMSLLSTTKDFSSAIQLLLQHLCQEFEIEGAYIVEPSVDEEHFIVSHVYTNSPSPWPIGRNQKLRRYHWEELAKTLKERGYAVNKDFVSLPLNEVESAWRDVMLAHESFLQLPMYGHDDMLTGFLVVLASDGNYVWQEKQIKWLQQICVGLNPYLMKNQFLARTDYLLNFDPLTRLPFLSHFKQEAQQILEESSETHYAVTYLDIYNFKFINDTYGFTVGDDILRQIGNMIQPKNQERYVCSGRVGDDNFVTLGLCEPGHIEEYQEFVNAFHDQISWAVKETYPGIELHINAGICEVGAETRDITQAIDNANEARKTIGIWSENISRVFDKDIRHRLDIEREMANSMHYALEHGEFQVYLQPKVYLQDEALSGAEALVRWQRPQGMIFPDAFIPFFEKNGFIIQLDLYMCEQVLKTLHRWKKKFGGNLPLLSVNLSRLHGGNPGSVENILALTKKYEIEPSLLEFELTESAVSENKNIYRMMQTLKGAGYHTSIDDFGSGYSSLNILDSIPASIIKLDKTFLHETEEGNHRVVIKYIIAMVKEIGMKVICEGVETQEQAIFLRSVGCDMAQGYYYAKPMPLKDFEKQYMAVHHQIHPEDTM